MISKKSVAAFSYCEYFLIKPRIALRVIGWADKMQSAMSPAVLVGLEPWLIARYTIHWFAPWKNSAIEHELTHILQEHEKKLLSKLWDPNLTRWRKWELWLQAEWEAMCLNPLWPWTVILIVIPPKVLFFIWWGYKFASDL